MSTKNKKNNASKQTSTQPVAPATDVTASMASVTEVTSMVTETVAEVTPAPAPVAKSILKKGPSPVFSIPATKENKEYISLQSTRTGKSQKELLTMAINAAREAINALPKFVEPVVEVKAKAKKADEAEAALAAAQVTVAPAEPVTI